MRWWPRRKTEDPIVLVQDYHFALLPRMIRERLPRRDDHHVLAHPLAQSGGVRHLPLAQRAPRRAARQQHPRLPHAVPLQQLPRHRGPLLEARVDRESFTISCRGQPTAVHRYPISIEWPPAALATRTGRRRLPGATVRERLGLPPRSRRSASASSGSTTPRASSSASTRCERLLELEPRWIGKFTFVQIAAPTPRADRRVPATTPTRVRALADEINARFARREAPADRACWSSTTSPTQVYEYYRAADLCFVSSLHDGMNLVAKEFVAARDDEQGVLILSQFAGASRELPEALIVNPYDTDQCAAALHLGADDARRRAARPDAHHARRGPRVQRLPLGGPHAARRRGDAPARALLAAPTRCARQWLSARALERAQPTPVARRCRPRRARRRVRGDCALFLDIDGTLLDLAERRSLVRVDAGVAALLPALLRCARRRGGADHRTRASPTSTACSPACACPSPGSTAASAAPPTAPLPPARADRRRHRARLREPCSTFDRAPPRPAARGQGHAHSPCTTAGAPRLAGYVHRAVQATCAAATPAAPPCACRPARCVIEIKPDGRDKGTAILEYMTEPPFRRPPAGVRRRRSHRRARLRRGRSTPAAGRSRSGRARRARATACPTSPLCARWLARCRHRRATLTGDCLMTQPRPRPDRQRHASALLVDGRGDHRLGLLSALRRRPDVLRAAGRRAARRRARHLRHRAGRRRRAPSRHT